MFMTIEKLAKKALSPNDAIVRYDDYVFVISVDSKGKYDAEIYELLEHPDTTDKGIVECRLNRIAQSGNVYSDSGHALAWCIEQAK